MRIVSLISGNTISIIDQDEMHCTEIGIYVNQRLVRDLPRTAGCVASLLMLQAQLSCIRWGSRKVVTYISNLGTSNQ